SSSRVPSLQRLSPPSPVLRTHPTPRPVRGPRLAPCTPVTVAVRSGRGLPCSAHALRDVPSLLPRVSRPVHLPTLAGLFCLRLFSRGSASPLSFTRLHL